MTLYRRSPRSISGALGPLSAEWAPRTLLSEVQRLWPAAVGEAVGLAARPVAERGGVLTVACSAAVWAQELDLMAPTILDAINGRLSGARLTRLRCVVDPT